MAQRNGRTPPPEKLYPFTFEDTGREVQIRKISTLLRAEVRRQVIASPGFAQPQPPQSEVDYGDGKIKIPNPAHPVYQDLLKEWSARVNEEVGARLRQVIINRAVVTEIDAEAVTQIRAEMAAAGSPIDHLSDHFVYVAYVCIGSERDYIDLVTAAYERSTPQEAVIQEHIATFQADVQGPGSVQPEP
jgi:hypothetical protein